MDKHKLAFLEHNGLWSRSLILIGLWAVGFFVATAFSAAVMFLANRNMAGLVTESATPAFLRTLQFLQSLFLILLPAILMACFISPTPWKYLGLTKAPSLRQIVLTIISMLLMVPFMNQIIVWNEAIRLPESLAPIEEWMRTKEDAANLMINQILDTRHWGGRIVNLLLVGVMAAVSEELFFRGLLQNLFFDKWHKRLLAVLLSAFLFSAIHLQFYGFVPRFLLGAYFGLLLIWTGNLWLPILAHFINNACALIQFYIEQNTEGNQLMQAASTDILSDGMNWLMIGSSILLFAYTAFCIKKSGA